MFGKKFFQVWASLLPVLMLVVSCAQTSAPTPIDEGGFPETTDNELANFVNQNTCEAQDDADTDGDGICDSVDPCPNSVDCNDDGIPDGKQRCDDGEIREDCDDGMNPWLEAGLWIVGTAGAVTLGNCIFDQNHNCLDYEFPWGWDDPDNPQLQFSFGGWDSGGSSAAFSTDSSGDHIVVLQSWVTTTEKIALRVNGKTKSLGKKARYCIHAKFETAQLQEDEHGVNALFQMNLSQEQRMASLATEDHRSDITTLINRCEDEPGIWVAVEKEEGSDEYYVTSMPPRHMGFIPTESGPDVADSRIVFPTFTSLANATMRFETVSPPVIATHPYGGAHENPSSSADETEFAAPGTTIAERIKMALGYRLDLPRTYSMAQAVAH